MEETFKKLCKEIEFEIPRHLEKSVIENVEEKSEVIDGKEIIKLEIGVNFFSLPSYDELKLFVKKTSKYFDTYKVELDLNIINKNYSKERILDLLLFGFEYFYNLDFSILINGSNVQFDINNFVLIIDVLTKTKLNLYNQYSNYITSTLSKFKINDIEIKINDLSVNILLEEQKKYEENQKLEIEKLQSLSKNKNPNSSDKKPSNYYKPKNKFFKVSLEQFYSTEEMFLHVEGKVFSIEDIITRTQSTIKVIQITDDIEAITTKMFLRSDNKNDYSWIKEDVYVSIFGEKKFDYNGTLTLFIKDIQVLNKDDQIIDESEEKRIELSARTSFSAMDGIVEPKKLLTYIKNMGHDAIGIVDFQNVQAFPDIYNNAKKMGIKPIYGSTFSVIDSYNGIVFNHKDMNINDESYIVFDLETTSLSPRLGEIIEFGAVEILKGNIINKHQFFIKPKKPISSFTTELTNITQEMLDKDSKYSDEKEAIKEIVRIFDNHTIVAHNAHFDMSFINEKLKQYELDPIKNQVIDTLALVKYLIPNSASYRLEAVAKKFGVSYDTNIAHRADYDAEVLQKIWRLAIENLSIKKIVSFKQLKEIKDPIIFNKKFAYDLAIYAKNQKGIKELFKLVSNSLTKDYYNGPKLIEDNIVKSNNLIYGPASIHSKLIDLMFTGTSKEIDKEIDKWDFIGIPSPHLFSHLIARGNCTKEELLWMLKDLVLRAKTKNKIIVAIGDTRYCSKKDALAHSIYINAKGLEGKRHILYKYNELNPKYPNQSILTTNEMKKQFSFLNSSNLVDEIVVKNPRLILSMVDDEIEIIKSKLYTPNFDNSETNLTKLVYENAYKKYGKNLPKIVEDRIQRELEPINKYGFSVVYWISHKLVAKSNQDGYLVGSRGSVGSSLVATLSGITEVNPLIPHYLCDNCKYNEFIEEFESTSGFDLPDKKCPNCNEMLKKDGQTIPFETFLGFNADKVPDIDLNFSGDYQPIIHQEARNMFGITHAFRAGTISTIAEKTAYGYAKKWDEDLSKNKSHSFINYLAKKIEGSKRTTGQHPGGIIIIPKEFDVEDFTPINYPANDTSASWQTTHFDFHAIHDNVLKLDLLGHDDPTMIRQLQKLTNVKMEEISFSDPKVISLFTSPLALGIEPKDINDEPTGALGIPEFNTKFVRKMLVASKPKNFNDLVNLSGLSHGTDVWNGNAEELIKQGYKLNEVISTRDDIMVYLIKKGIDPLQSFQIMERVRKGQGLTPENEKILAQYEVPQWYINSLQKIKYMFPKAHATAYVMMAWRIAWFKIYYPLEYYATYFTVRSDIFDLASALSSKEVISKKLHDFEARSKLQDSNKLTTKEQELFPTFEILNEMMARGFKIANIDLYKSKADEWIIDYEKNMLIPPFTSIDGMGLIAAKSIEDARKEREFVSINDFSKRTSVNKTIIEKMIGFKILSTLEESDQIKLF